jgi:hypothetical protein
MSSMTSAVTLEAGAPRSTRLGDLRTIAYWATLGAAAGGLGGMVVGGIGGRLAMLLLRFTSDRSVRGIESDDGFTIGIFDLTSTLSLLVVTGIFGAVVGLIVVFGRPFFRRPGMPFAWAAAGAIAGGALLVQKDGVDFTALGPGWLTVGLFVLIPGLGAGLIAWLTELFPRFWWRRRGMTAAASLGLLPLVPGFPVIIGAAIVGAAWWMAMQIPASRSFPAWKPARIAAGVVFALVIVLGGYDLARDARAIV